MEQVKERAKALRIIAGVAVIICALYGIFNRTVYWLSIFGAYQVHLTFIQVVNGIIVPYLSYVLSIVLGALVLAKKIKGVFIVAVIKFVLAYYTCVIEIYDRIIYALNYEQTIIIPTTSIIISLFSHGGLLCLSLVAFLRQKTNNKAGFVLSIIFFVITVYGYFTNLLNTISITYGTNNVAAILSLAAYTLLSVYLAFKLNAKPPKKSAQPQVVVEASTGSTAQQAEYTQQFNVNVQQRASTAEDYGYQDMVKFVVLCFVTFGIWYYIWIYKTVKNLELGGKSKDAGLELVLVMFVPFYYIYWLYKASKSLDEQLKAYGSKADDVVVITLVLSLLVGSTIGGIYLQYKINELARLKQAANPTVTVNVNGTGTKN